MLKLAVIAGSKAATLDYLDRVTVKARQDYDAERSRKHFVVLRIALERENDVRKYAYSASLNGKRKHYELEASSRRLEVEHHSGPHAGRPWLNGPVLDWNDDAHLAGA